MAPIVDGLQETFGEEMLFVALNADEGNGEILFRRLSLPGHPSFVIFSTDKTESYRAIGVFKDNRLHDAILNQLSSP